MHLFVYLVIAAESSILVHEYTFVELMDLLLLVKKKRMSELGCAVRRRNVNVNWRELSCQSTSADNCVL